MDRIISEFCAKNRHHLRKFWERAQENKKLFTVAYEYCTMCGVRKLLKKGADRCPICNERLETHPTSSQEDISRCQYCGFSNLDDPCGVPTIPGIDIGINFKTG